MAMPTVAPLSPGDLDDIMPLERRCFKDPWSRTMYLSDLTQNPLATYLVLHPGPQHSGRAALPPVLAYGGFWLLLDEAHIATLAAHPEWRNCGLGQWMMLALLDAAVGRGAARSTLEVRVGNLAARHLYEKLGYTVAGLRRRYYRDGEDGLIMTTGALASAPMRERLEWAREDAIRRLAACFEEQTV